MFFYIFIGFMVVVLVLIITAIAQPPNKMVEHYTRPRQPQPKKPPEQEPPPSQPPSNP